MGSASDCWLCIDDRGRGDRCSVWNAAEAKKLALRIEKLKQAGEPILPSDFDPPPDGPDNGGGAIIAAGEAIAAYVKDHPRPDLKHAALPLQLDERSAIEQHQRDLRDVYKQLRIGLAKPRQDWVERFTNPLAMGPSTEISTQRHVTVLLTSAALLEHETGNERAVDSEA